MAIRPPRMPGSDVRSPFTMRERHLNPDAATITRVMAYWDEGMDTYDISREMLRPEAEIDRALWRGRERRIRARNRAEGEADE